MPTDEQVNLETESQEKPNSEPSPQKSGVQAEEAQVLSDAQVALVEQISGRIAKSLSDKRTQRHENLLQNQGEQIADVVKQQGSIKDTLAEVKRYQDEFGYTEAQAVRELQRDRDLATLMNGDRGSVSNPTPQGSGVDLSAYTAGILQAGNIDPSSDAAKTFLAGLTETDPAKIGAATAKFVIEQAAKPQSSEAEIPSSTDGQTPDGKNFIQMDEGSLWDEATKSI